MIVSTRRAPLLAVLGLLAAGFSPFEADEEHVTEGNARLAEGDPDAALRSYAEAERTVGSRPEIDHDRGNAALAAGRPEEAKESWRRAAERAPPALASRALQNLGTALAAEGDREGALRAFSDALVKDPTNEDARFDLEVLLRESSPPAPPPSAGGGASEAPRPQAGGASQEPRADGGAKQQAPDPARAAEEGRERPAPGEGEPQQRPEAGAAERDRGQHGERSGADATRGGEPGREPLSREAAEALLDSLRAREKHLPFLGRERRKGARRADAAKDW